MLVGGQHFSDEIIARIRSRVGGDFTLTRTALSREVCGWLGWQGAGVKPKDMSCRVALFKLSRRGVIELPAAQKVAFVKAAEPSTPQAWLSLETTLNELGQVRLVAVDSGQAELSRTW